MGVIARITRIGNSLAIILPKPFCRQKRLVHGDIFEIDDDIMIPNIYTFKKIGNNNGKL